MLYNSLVLIIGGVGLVVDQAGPGHSRLPPVVWIAKQANGAARLRAIVELEELPSDEASGRFERSLSKSISKRKFVAVDHQPTVVVNIHVQATNSAGSCEKEVPEQARMQMHSVGETINARIARLAGMCSGPAILKKAVVRAGKSVVSDRRSRWSARWFS